METNETVQAFELLPEQVIPPDSLPSGTLSMAMAVARKLKTYLRENPEKPFLPYRRDPADLASQAIAAAWSCGLIRIRAIAEVEKGAVHYYCAAKEDAQ